MSVDGLISGMDTTSLITQLIQAEAGQQTALKKRLSTTELAASAYRTVNTTFAAVRAAAEAALKAESWTPTKATSSSTGVAVSSSTTAATGSLSFTVVKTAAAHTVVNKNDATWNSADAAYGASGITVSKAGVAVSPPIAIGDADGDGVSTLNDAAAAINASSHGLTAAVVEVGAGQFGLLVTSKTTGLKSEFSLSGAGRFTVPKAGVDAEIRIGDTAEAVTLRSATNTFTSVLPGVTITVSEPTTTAVTVNVTPDPDAVAGKVQALVDAVNSALGTVRTYTSNAPGSTAALKGDYAVTSLGGQLLDAVAFAVGPHGSPAKVGFELTRDGKITFDKAEFLTALKDTPELARRMVAGGPATAGPDRTAGNNDDLPAVTGIAGRLLAVTKAASDTATGSLVKLAEGQDSLVKDLKERIEAWDLRLAKRKEILTRQFTAMETALSSLRNQSTWLAGQLNSLPSSG